MSEVEDATSRQLKRRRVDLGLPRGNHTTKINGFVSSNGAFQENVENNSEVLRNLLNLNRSSPSSTLAWGTADSCDSYKRHKPAEDHSSGQEEEEDEEIVNSASRGSGEKLQTVDVECADVASRGGQSAAMPTAQTANWEHSNGSTSPMQESITESLKAKRARVENIITSMRHSPPTVSAQDMVGMEDSLRKPKRKQYQPQPQRWESGEEPPTTAAPAPAKQARKQERHKLKGLLHHLQNQLDSLQERYLTMFDEDEGSLSDNSDDMDDLNEPIDTTSAIHKYNMNGVGGHMTHVRNSERKRRADGSSVLDPEASHIIRQTLKEELTPLLLTAVDSVVNKLTTKSASKNAKSHTANATTEINHPAKNSVLAQHASPPPLISERKPTPPPTTVPASFFMRSFHRPLEQTEAMSLVVPSRKRVRSNDRSPLMGYHGSEVPMKPEPIIPVSLPTSVAIPNPSLHPTLAATFMTPPMTDPREHFENMRFSGSPMISSAHLSPLHYMSDHRSSPGDLSHISGESLGYSLVKPESRDTPPHQTHERPSSADLSDYSPVNGTSITATLTPTHLRKAKLMFFFTRYPSSALLRQHFPDVKFNRHNTSQIIKWFSNFREFYYIQMEKFSRQAVSDNLENSDDLQVTRESELFRALNLHYNKSNEFTVPESFIHVSTTTLREFFNAIKTGKDVEPSWKKTIYKVISKLDEPLPPFFKNPNCLDLLPL